MREREREREIVVVVVVVVDIVNIVDYLIVVIFDTTSEDHCKNDGGFVDTAFAVVD